MSFASECKDFIRPIGVTLYKLGKSDFLTEINEVQGGGGPAASERNTGRGKGKKYVEMTKADAMQEAPGEDEKPKMARLPSDGRKQSSFPLKSNDYTNANQTDRHKRLNK